MNTQRLQHLITILENVPEEKFDLKNWACGATACAIGHAALDPVFVAEGFKLQAEQLDADFPRVAYPIFDLSAGCRFDGFEAVHVFFDLTPDQASDLFMSWAYFDRGIAKPQPQDVIHRIRELLA